MSDSVRHTVRLRPEQIESTLLYMQQLGAQEDTDPNKPAEPRHHYNIETIHHLDPLECACESVIDICKEGEASVFSRTLFTWYWILMAIVPLWMRRSKGRFGTNPLCTAVKRAIKAIEATVTAEGGLMEDIF